MRRAGRPKPWGWARERDLFVDDDQRYLQEFEHVTLARVLMARHKNDPDDSNHKAMGLRPPVSG